MPGRTHGHGRIGPAGPAPGVEVGRSLGRTRPPPAGPTRGPDLLCSGHVSAPRPCAPHPTAAKVRCAPLPGVVQLPGVPPRSTAHLSGRGSQHPLQHPEMAAVFTSTSQMGKSGHKSVVTAERLAAGGGGWPVSRPPTRSPHPGHPPPCPLILSASPVSQR